LRIDRGPDEVLEAPLTLLVKIFGPGTMRIYNAVLQGHRVLFVGCNHAAGDVCRLALAAASLVAPPLSGVVRRRVYPYANLTDLAFLEAPGYIAGVTNPVFETNESWWDILCELHLSDGTGRVLTAKEKREENERSRGEHAEHEREKEPPYASLDRAFYAKVAAGCGHYGERWVRTMFYEYTMDIVDTAIDHGINSHLAASVIQANAPRVHRLVATADWAAEAARFLDPWRGDETVDPTIDPSTVHASRRGVSGLADLTTGRVLRNTVRKLRNGCAIELEEEEEMYQILVKTLTSEPALQTLLQLLPEDKGGINTIAAGLLSASTLVKVSTVTLLQRMERFPSTKPAVRALNHFLNIAFCRAAVLVPRPHIGDGGEVRRSSTLRPSSLANLPPPPAGVPAGTLTLTPAL